MKKFVTTAVALGALLATSASAATTQSEIDALLAQIAALQAGTTVSTTSTFVYAGGLLKVGSTGSQVEDLQRCLAVLGNNPSSNIDGVFGNITKSAVMSFQASNGVAVDGIIGPVTGPLYTAACSATVEVEEEVETVVVETEAVFQSTGGDEGEVIALEINGGEDEDLFSDSKGQELFEIEIEADEDGSDVLIERMDLEFTVSGDEDRNYKVIEAIEIEGFGSLDTDDKDDWRSDEVTARINGSAVVKAGETETFVVVLDIAEFDEDNGQDVTLESVEIRYEDEAGVTYSNDIASTGTETVSYDASSVFAIDVDESDDQEDDATIDLDGDVNDVEIAIFDLEVDEDVEEGILDELTVTIAGVSDDSEDLVKELTLYVDGEEIDSVNAESDGTFVFDLDEWELEAEDMVEIVLEADLEDQDADPFVSTTFQVTGLAFTGEDKDGDDLTDASVDGTVITVAGTLFTTSLGDIEYEVSNIDTFTAVNDTDASTIEFDLDISNDSGADITIADGLTDADFLFDFEGISDVTITLVSLEEDDTDAQIASYVIEDGDSETFTVFGTFTLENDDEVEVELEEVLGVTPVEA